MTGRRPGRKVPCENTLPLRVGRYTSDNSLTVYDVRRGFFRYEKDQVARRDLGSMEGPIDNLNTL